MEIIVLLLGIIIGVMLFTYYSRDGSFFLFSIYLDLPNVVIHECGHGLVAKLCGGELDSIKFNMLPSQVKKEAMLGSAVIGTKSKLGFILSNLGGYITQSLFFSLMILLYMTNKSLLIIPIFLGVYLVTNLLAKNKSILQNLLVFLVLGLGIYFYKTNVEVLVSLYGSLGIITRVFTIWYAAGLVHQILIVAMAENDSYWDGHWLESDTKIPTIFWKFLFLVVMIGSYFSIFWVDLVILKWSEFLLLIQSVI